MLPIDLRAVKTMVRMADVLRLLDWQPATKYGTSMRGPCPVHGSTDPRSRSFAVRGNGWYCHGCKKGGSQLDLWMLTHAMTARQAAVDLCGRLGYGLPTLLAFRGASSPRNRKRNS